MEKNNNKSLQWKQNQIFKEKQLIFQQIQFFNTSKGLLFYTGKITSQVIATPNIINQRISLQMLKACSLPIIGKLQMIDMDMPLLERQCWR